MQVGRGFSQREEKNNQGEFKMILLSLVIGFSLDWFPERWRGIRWRVEQGGKRINSGSLKQQGWKLRSNSLWKTDERKGLKGTKHEDELKTCES